MKENLFRLLEQLEQEQRTFETEMKIADILIKLENLIKRF